MEKRKVTIESGELQGIFGYDPRITVFKGVPYAAAPVGDLRWRAPQPVKPWDGVRLAAEYGPMAMQKVPGADPNEFWTKELHPAGPEFEMSEDCLYLNVFTPAKKGDEKLPVLFYIHGGGLTGGYPYEVEFDWEHMARKGIVVVTVAYRLGIFGFFAHPELSAEAPDDPVGCCGYLDQQAALRWTKRNIAAFGGDPDKVTIAGQSAGAGSVMSQLASPGGKDLFRGAIVESGINMTFSDIAGRSRNVSVETAEKNGADFFEKAGYASLAEARAASAEEIFARCNENGFRFNPAIDGRFLMQDSSSAMVDDNWGDRPVIFGYNSGEVAQFNRFGGTSPQNMEELLACAEKYGDRKDEFLALCNCKTDEDVKALMSSPDYTSLIVSTYTAGHLRTAQGHKTWLYEFGCDIPGEDHPGSYHGAELPFAYDALARMWRPYSGKHYDLARAISSYWVNFVKTGDPNGLDTNGEPLPSWDPCDENGLSQMYFGDNGCEARRPELTPLMRIRWENTKVGR